MLHSPCDGILNQLCTRAIICSQEKEEAPASTHDADAGARERLQAVLLVLAGGQGASESRESLILKKPPWQAHGAR